MLHAFGTQLIRRGMSSQSTQKFKLALVQLGNIGTEEEANVNYACTKVNEAAHKGANVIVLPECFNSPYGAQFFPKYARPLSKSYAVEKLSQVAKANGVYIFGGSIPELDETTNKVYNTLTVYDPSGKRIAKHRKLHLFDIDIPGKITFRESDTLTAGDCMTHVDTSYGRIGVGICYDMRFPEMAMVAARKGCMVMIYPGAFNLTTGPLHWELLLRARAMDNQIFTAGCSPARDMNATYHAWGHSSIVNPSGEVIASCDEKETIVYANIDPSNIDSVRSGIPIYEQRRFDVYCDVAETVVVDENGHGKKKIQS